jgi:hypothetical protein
MSSSATSMSQLVAWGGRFYSNQFKNTFYLLSNGMSSLLFSYGWVLERLYKYEKSQVPTCGVRSMVGTKM